MATQDPVLESMATTRIGEQRRFEHLCGKVSTALTCAGVTRKKLLASLPEARQRVFDRRYGKDTVKARR
jgi:hypothetical protein